MNLKKLFAIITLAVLSFSVNAQSAASDKHNYQDKYKDLKTPSQYKDAGNLAQKVSASDGVDNYKGIEKKNNALECTNAELKRYIDIVTNPIQQKINRVKTPEEKCFDWTQLRETEKGEKGADWAGGCVTQICGRLPGLDFGKGGFGGLFDMLSNPMAALSKKLSQKLQDAWQKAKCSIIEAPTKALQGIVTSGEKAADQLGKAPDRAIGGFIGGVDRTVSKTIDKTLRDNKYIGPIMKYSGGSSLSDDIDKGSQGVGKGLNSFEKDISDFGSGVYDYLDDR